MDDDEDDENDIEDDDKEACHGDHTLIVGGKN